VLGCIHHLAKYSNEYLEALRVILERSPKSILVCRRSVLGDAGTREAFASRLKNAGLPMSRVQLQGDGGAIATRACFHDFDLVPDAFPFTGDATTCDALRMGVPVVSLMGQHLCARRGAALLRRIGFERLIASDRAEYIEIICNLLSQPDELLGIRRGVSEAFVAYSRKNGPQFARSFAFLIEELVGKIRECA